MNAGFYIAIGVSAVCSYLLGGVNGAIIMSSLVYHEDIREKGSSNPGFTNFKRVYGLSAVTWSVMLIDILKTLVPVMITAVAFGRFFNMYQIGAAFSGLCCMLGHCFPVWYSFRGGKAFIAGFTTIWFVDWRMALIATVIFFIVLVACRYMSVASCTAAFCCPIILMFLATPFNVVILSSLSALLVIVRHYPNFVKLINKQESKFTFGKKAER